MTHSQRIDFDGWTLHTGLGELERDGQRVRLQDQPLQVLQELLTHPGELVTREQLIARLWPKGVVDYDLGLNSAVRKLRVALNDEADTPRYIQTIPRKGYRFIGTLDPARSLSGVPTASTSTAKAEQTAPRDSVATPAPDRGGHRALIYGAIVALLVAGVAVVLWQGNVRRAQPSAPPTAASLRLAPPSLAVIADHVDPTAEPLAAAVSAVLHDRLADFNRLAVIAPASADIIAEQSKATLPPRANRQYWIRVGVQGDAPAAHVGVALFDATSSSQLWSESFEANPVDLISIRDRIADRVAATLKLQLNDDLVASVTPVDPNAYELYARARRLIANFRPRDADEAALLLTRVTELEPQFARAYAALGHALMLTQELRNQPFSSPTIDRAQLAFDRALTLNPRLGEVWIHRARLATDHAEIEEFYHRGRLLAPGYDIGHANYAKFLIDRRRRGEAIDVIEEARRVDPYSITLFQSDAVAKILSRSDVAAHDAVLQEALRLQPDNTSLLLQFAQATYLWKGDLAESIRLLEHAMKIDPERESTRLLAATIYLDLDEPAAAAALFADAPHASATVELAQYRRDARRAAEFAAKAPIAPFHAVAPVAEALRDAALASGDFAPALARLETAYNGWGAAPISIRSVAAAYAHTLVLAGERDRGIELAQSLLTQVEAEGAARPSHWFARDRASLFAILGDEARALDELELSVEGQHVDRWWYTSKVDPLFATIRRDPRFLALDQRVRRHRTEQRALLEQMRRDGLVPRERPRARVQRSET